MKIGELHINLVSMRGFSKVALQKLHKLEVTTLYQLLTYYPRAYSDRTKLVSLHQALEQEQATVEVDIIDHRLIGNRYKKILKILIRDKEGNNGALMCFNRNFLAKVLPVGGTYFITGKFTFSYNEIQTSSFEYEEATSEYEGKILPIYPLTEGLTQGTLRKYITKALDNYLPQLDEDMPAWIIERYQLMGVKQSLRYLHNPPSFDVYYQARRSMIFRDFFYQKLVLLQRKKLNAKKEKQRRLPQSTYTQKIEKKLPFALTAYQKEALQLIINGVFAQEVFMALLQGDVGSGKTIVALFVALMVIEAGYQVVLLAPTEVLATQHYKTAHAMFAEFGIDTALLHASIEKKNRASILEGLDSGEIKFVVGTHSVFSDDVKYAKLGLAIIDEQHRFGVRQREKLQQKGDAVDMLLMSATPIPQSLALAVYGDMDLITMRGHISGRLPVKTWHIEDDAIRISNMHEWIREELAKAGRVIFVYPRIDDEENSSGRKSLIEEFKKLSKLYADYGCESIYSGTAADEKQRIINEFREGKIKVLAATTVVEVGLDVPDASIIVIENAEVYGLSTLHQLRGRVGRSSQQGYMIMITDASISEEGKSRLDLLRTEHDGFKIAEADLLMRGPGDFLSKKQSGAFGIKLADIKADMKTLIEASDAAVAEFSK